MEERTHKTEYGTIHYYVDLVDSSRKTLLFLPGLSADHTLFTEQICYFKGKYNILTWDAPGHAASRPFSLTFSLKDKARWVYDIIKKEQIEHPVLVGQSMGGYVSQVFQSLYPGVAEGMVMIDSAPIQKEYAGRFDLFFMDHAEGMYRMFPWKTLLKAGSDGVASTPKGRKNMKDMMLTYNDNPGYYAKLVGHGYRMLAQIIREDLQYAKECPMQLICGEEDKAGYTKDYNKRWHEGTNYPISWIKGAGHNSNVDQPEEINRIIEEFLKLIIDDNK